jgi:hypothetical protein
MRVRTRFVLQIVAVSVLGMLAGWAVARYAKGSQRPIELGDGKYDFDSALDTPLPPLARLSQSDRVGVVLGISKYSLPSEYLGVLKRKYESQGLKLVVAFSPESAHGNVELAKSIGVPWVVDKDGSMQLLLKCALTHHHDAILIYDSSYRVKFHALDMPSNDLLRQLVEKYLTGRIDYSPTHLLASSLVGKRVAGLQCLSERPPSDGVFVLFPPGCSSCELNSYREQLKRARVSSWASNAQNDKWTLVFVNGRDGRTVALAQDLGFQVHDVCGVRGDVLVDPYQTRKNPGTEPLLLRVGNGGVVDDVQELWAVSSGVRQ